MNLVKLAQLFETAIAPEPDARFATKAEIRHLAQNLAKDMPGVRFDVDTKSTVKDVPYIRVFGSDKQTIVNYFKRVGLDSLPLEPQQAALSSKYKSNILSYNAGNVFYSIVVAGSGKKDDTDTGVTVSIKEFTPVTLGLAGQPMKRSELITRAKKAIVDKTKTRPELQQILLGLIEVAAGNLKALPPEVNVHLSDRARNQLSVDFGEILAPIMFAKKSTDNVEFPAEGNFPLIDAIVDNGTAMRYSVKSLTGSGTSFRSISDLMDNYEGTIEKGSKQEKLFALFKAYHPKAGGKNVDKLIVASAYIGLPEYKKAVQVLGSKFLDYAGLLSLVQKQGIDKDRSDRAYGAALNLIYPILTAGPWGKPVGLPADGAYYMGTKKDKVPAEKAAGFPSFKHNPAKAITDILTYALGVGTLNEVTRGADAEEYAQMMTNIVNQSPAWLGRLDITDDGQVVASAKPFSDLKFKFQYHAPSHMPGNNLPGFMIIY